MPNLFIATVTGQNQANLPPIFHFGKKGDTILWLVSPEMARHPQTVERSNSVLRKRNFQTILSENLNATDWLTPTHFATKIANLIAKNAGKFSEVYFIINGGPKYCMVGIEQFRGLFLPDNPVPPGASIDSGAAVRRQLHSPGIPVHLVYTQPNAAKLLQLESGAQKLNAVAIENAINFDEFLALDGFTSTPSVKNPKSLVYAPGTGRTCASPPDNLYFRQFQDSRDWIPTAFLWKEATAKQQKQRIDQSTVDGLVRMGWLKAATYAPDHEFKSDDWRNVDPRGGRDRIDNWFEDAVCARLLQFLEQEHRASVSEVVLSAALSTAQQPDFGEFDIAVLLKNANVVHLECKSVLSSSKEEERTQKNMKGQTFTLQDAAGYVAKQLIVSPFFTSFSTPLASPWEQEVFGRQRSFFENMRNLELATRSFIRTAPFTLSKHTKSVPSATYNRGNLDVPTFEEVLREEIPAS